MSETKTVEDAKEVQTQSNDTSTQSKNDGYENIQKNFEILTKELQGLKKQINDSNNQKESLSKDEIRKLAEQRIKEREIEAEMQKIKLESQEEQKQKEDPIKSRTERNRIERHILNEFLQEKYTKYQMMEAESNPEFAYLLGKSLFRYLADQNGLSQSTIDNSNPLDMLDWFHQIKVPAGAKITELGEE